VLVFAAEDGLADTIVPRLIAAQADLSLVQIEDVYAHAQHLTLPEPVSIAYALGAMAGLRTGEIIALRWESVDLDKRTITVRLQADRNSGEERAPKHDKRLEVPISTVCCLSSKPGSSRPAARGSW
jgi:integrase